MTKRTKRLLCVFFSFSRASDDGKNSRDMILFPPLAWGIGLKSKHKSMVSLVKERKDEKNEGTIICVQS